MTHGVWKLKRGILTICNMTKLMLEGMDSISSMLLHELIPARQKIFPNKENQRIFSIKNRCSFTAVTDSVTLRSKNLIMRQSQSRNLLKYLVLWKLRFNTFRTDFKCEYIARDNEILNPKNLKILNAIIPSRSQQLHIATCPKQRIGQSDLG